MCLLKVVKRRKYIVVYPEYRIIIKSSDVSQVRNLNVNAMLVGCFQVVEHMSWK